MAPPRRYCTIDGCDERRIGRGYCEKHYRKWRRFGTPTPPESENGIGLRDEVERFWAKVDKTAGPDGCWLWTATTWQNGYGNFWSRKAGRKVLAHRYSYELANGAPPADLLVCHSCDVRNCVNPAHLWLGTHHDNHRDKFQKGRGPTPSQIPKRCAHGHILADVGYWTLSATIICRPCSSERVKKLRAEEKARRESGFA